MSFKAEINGVEVKAKNRLVLEVVKQFIIQNPTITYQKIKTIFPDSLQGSYGILKNEEDLLKWENDGRTENRNKRFFTNKQDLILHNNDKLYICTQWGSGKKENIDNFIKYCIENLNFNINISTFAYKT